MLRSRGPSTQAPRQHATQAPPSLVRRTTAITPTAQSTRLPPDRPHALGTRISARRIRHRHIMRARRRGHRPTILIVSRLPAERILLALEREARIAALLVVP